MPKPPLHIFRLHLPYKSVHVQCLDNDGKEISNATASGFIVNEKGKLFLYTCWHVVTGYDMHEVKIRRSHPNRHKLRVTLQQHETRQPGVNVTGGSQSFDIELYDEEDQQLRPKWNQESQDRPNLDLNIINIKVPKWFDVVKLTIPDGINIPPMQIFSEDEIYRNSAQIGDKIYIVGYPYGYSALGLGQPTSVVITRHVAATSIQERDNQMLLDGPGAPGMSGGPILIEKDNAIYLTGIYTGLIYPDYIIEKNEKTTALGTYCNLIVWWSAVAGLDIYCS